jgi:hypothetical protein
MVNIFISYRREDSLHQAGRLYDRLAAYFGSRHVFKDVDSIPLGVDFREVLTERVAGCDVFVAVIGDTWLSITGKGGIRRLDDPGEFVRIEIEAALSRKIPVIPVLVGHSSLPHAEELPETLRALSFRNGLPVRPDPDFHKDLDRLIRGIEDGISALRARPTPRETRSPGPGAEETAGRTQSPDLRAGSPGSPSATRAPGAPAGPPAAPAPPSAQPRPPAAGRSPVGRSPDRPSEKKASPLPIPAQEPGALAAPRPERPRPRWPMIVAAASLGLFLFGVIIYVETDKGRIRLVVNDPKAVIKIDGQAVRVEALGKPITLRAGEHALEVTWGDGEFETRKFVVRRGDDERLRIEYEPTRNRGGTATPKKVETAGPSVAGASKLESSTTQIQSTTPKPSLSQLEHVFVKGSVWKGQFRSTKSASESRWELYVQERVGPTFRGVHVNFGDIRKTATWACPVRGTVRANDLRYWPAAPDGQTFIAIGSWNGANLEMELDARGGAVTKARLQRDPDKPEWARLEFSVYDESDNDGWYTRSQDGSGPATQPIIIAHTRGMNVYWLHANALPDGKRWEWHAPAKYHGDHSAKFGRCIAYGLFADQASHVEETYQFVRLRSAGMTLYLDGSGRQAQGSRLEPPGQGQRKNYCVRLDASAGWKKSGTGEQASDQDIKEVLAEVTDLCITGGHFGARAGVGCLWSVWFGADDPFNDNSPEAASKPGP